MLKDYKVGLHTKRKDTLSPDDLGILLKTHWVYDTTVHPHERQRVDLSALDLFAYITGSRPGALLSQYDSTKKTSTDESSLFGDE